MIKVSPPPKSQSNASRSCLFLHSNNNSKKDKSDMREIKDIII